MLMDVIIAITLRYIFHNGMSMSESQKPNSAVTNVPAGSQKTAKCPLRFFSLMPRTRAQKYP